MLGLFTHHIRQDVVETHGAADGQDDGLVGVVDEQDEARRNGGVSVVGWRGLRQKNIQVQNPQPLERTWQAMDYAATTFIIL